MTSAVTGATGHLGRPAVASLLDRGVPAGRIIVGRSVEKNPDLADRGVVVRRSSYDDVDALTAAFHRRAEAALHDLASRHRALACATSRR